MSNENQPRFDPHAFAGRRSFAVSADSGISHSDYKGMHNRGADKTARRRRTGMSPIPAWALDDKKLAAVVKLKMWRYVHGGVQQMPPETTLEELRKAVEKHHSSFLKRSGRENLPAYQRLLADSHLRFCNAAGGYAGQLVKVIWSAYRMNLDSVGVAQECDLRPEQARAILQRLNIVARELFPEDTPPLNEMQAKAGSCSKGKGKKGSTHAWSYSFDGHKVHEMRLAGKTWRACAYACNSKHCNLVRRHYGDWLRNNAAEVSGEVTK